MTRARSILAALPLAALLAGCSGYTLDPHEGIAVGRFSNCALRVTNHGPSPVEVWTQALATKPRAAKVDPGHVCEFELPPVIGTDVRLHNLGDQRTTVDVSSRALDTPPAASGPAGPKAPPAK